jgi:hypothetical protein
MPDRYHVLDPAKVIETIAALQRRISERFPGAGLADVCAELLVIARDNSARAARIGRRNMPLRVAIFLLLAAGLSLLAWVLTLIDVSRTSADNVYTQLQGVEAALNIVVLTGAALFFLATLEVRIKRRRALRALHELRSIVHVIDMHQLTKDPSTAVSIAGNTASSPARALSPFEVTRYLDYCSEMVSLTAKVAVLFAQVFPDPTVTETVSDIERIASGLSQKIWQKIMIVQALAPDGARQAGNAQLAPRPPALAVATAATPPDIPASRPT